MTWDRRATVGRGREAGRHEGPLRDPMKHSTVPSPSEVPGPGAVSMLRGLLDASREPMAVVDGQGALVAWNEAARRCWPGNESDPLLAAGCAVRRAAIARAVGDGQSVLEATDAFPALELGRLDGAGATLVVVRQGSGPTGIDDLGDMMGLLDRLPVMSWVSDARHRVIFQNAAARDFLGVQPDDWTRAIPDQARSKVVAASHRNLETRQPFVAEHPAIRGVDGSGRRLQHHATPVHDGKGNFLGYVAFTFDVTESHFRELRERRRAELAWSAFRNAPIGAVVISPEGRYTNVNPTVCGMFGFTRDEFLQLSLGDLTDEATHEEDRRLWDDFRAGALRSHQDQRAYIRKDGSRFLGERTLTGVYDDRGELDFIAATVADVTEREEALARARRAETELRRLTDSLPVIIAHIGADLRFRFANKAYETWIGINPDHLIGVRFDELLGETLYERMRPHAEAAMRGENVKFDWSAPMPNGRDRYIGSQYVPNIGPDGRQDGFFVVVMDVTERTEQEARIRDLNEELEERVRQRTARLQNLNDELEAFCYSVSHDLRAPLRATEGFSSILLAEYGDKLGEDGGEWLRRIVAASHRGGRLIDELLNLSRVTRAAVVREPVDLSAVASRIATELATGAPQRQVEFRIEPGLVVSADPTLATGMMENLVGNAWKFTSTREVGEIEVGRDPATGEICVGDNGVGFDMRFADQLFAPFQGLHQHDEFEGDGIGLATVKRIISRHDGSIRADSAPGQGARFYFRFSGATASEASSS